VHYADGKKKPAAEPNASRSRQIPRTSFGSAATRLPQ